MKRFAYLLATLVALSVAAISCGNKSTDSTNQEEQSVSYTYDNEDILPNGTPGLARKIIDEDLFIDLDTAQLNEAIQFTEMCNMKIMAGDTTATQVPDHINDYISQSKAAIYRFMSKLTIVDNRMVLDPNCTPEMLKMRPEIFQKLLEDIENTNESMAMQEAAGNEVMQLPPIDDEQLNHILE